MGVGGGGRGGRGSGRGVPSREALGSGGALDVCVCVRLCVSDLRRISRISRDLVGVSRRSQGGLGVSVGGSGWKGWQGILGGSRVRRGSHRCLGGGSKGLGGRRGGRGEGERVLGSCVGLPV